MFPLGLQLPVARHEYILFYAHTSAKYNYVSESEFGKVFYFLPKGSLSIVMLRIDRTAVPLMYLFSELNEAYR